MDAIPSRLTPDRFDPPDRETVVSTIPLFWAVNINR